jgi:hypothetical protein
MKTTAAANAPTTSAQTTTTVEPASAMKSSAATALSEGRAGEANRCNQRKEKFANNGFSHVQPSATTTRGKYR